MSKMGKNIEKIKKYVASHKKQLIIISILIVVLIVEGIIYYNINHPLKKDNGDNRLNKTKTVEDLTKVEKEILDVEDKDTKTEIEKAIENNYSDEYKKYEQLSQEEKDKLEVIPREENIPIGKLDDIKEEIDKDEENITIPDSYNLKDHINLRVANQGGYGLCWNFSSIKTLETNLQLHEGKDLDLSELHLDYMLSNLVYGSRELHSGGSFSDFETYSLLSGAVLEDTVPYWTSVVGSNGGLFNVTNDFPEEVYSNFINIETVVRATDVVNFPSIKKTNGVVDSKDIDEKKLNEFRNLVKKHIMKNGALYTVIVPPDDDREYYDSKTYSQYYNGDASLLNPDRVGFHAVSIVGWDDKYSKNNFATSKGDKPKNDGAYIALNSWGENWGDNGYFYISYEDSLVESELSGVVSSSIEDLININSIQNPVLKEIINNQLKYYIIDYNNDKYISKLGLSKVNSIDLKDKSLTSEDLKGLELFNNLIAIDLSDNNITDISILANFKKLSFVNLSNNNVNDVSALKDLDNLSEVNLSGNDKLIGFEQLNNLNNLHILNLNNTNLTALDISNIDNLSILDLSNNTHLDYSNLKLPKSIMTLALDNTNFTDNNLSELELLSSLSIKNNNLTNLKSLIGVKTLRTLDVSNNNITDFSSLSEIFGQKDEMKDNVYYGNYFVAKENGINDISFINNVNVSFVDFSNNNISDLSSLDNDKIITINLSYNKINRGIESLKNVMNIHLDYCGISDLTGFSELKNVSSLYLNGNNITDFNELKNLDKLVTLSLNNNKITDLSQLSNFKNIRNLNLADNDLIDVTPLNRIESLELLSLSGNTKIEGKLTGAVRTLNLENCNLDNSFDLTGLEEISSLNLSGNDFTEIKRILDNSKSDYLIIIADNLVISEEDLSSFEDYSKRLDKSMYSTGFVLNIDVDIDENNNINIDRNSFIRKLLISQLKNNIVINNGIIDKKVNYIHVLNPDDKKVSFKESYSSGMNYYNNLDFSLSY